MNINRALVAGAIAVALSTLGTAPAQEAEQDGPPTFFGIPIVIDDDAQSLQQRRAQAREAHEARSHAREDADDRSPSADAPEQSEAAAPNEVIWIVAGEAAPESVRLPEVYQSLRKPRSRDLVRLVTTLHQAYECRTCVGDGLVTEKRKVGEVQNGNLVRPIYEDITKDCPRCGGDGYGSGTAINRLVANITTHLALLQLEDPGYDDALRRAHGAMSVMLEKDSAALAERLNPVNVDILRRGAQRGRVIGQPLVAMGEVVAVGTLPEAEVLVVTVTMGDSLAVVSDLRLADPPALGEMMLFGGMVAGFVQHESDALPVVQRGYLVASEARPASIVGRHGVIRPEQRAFLHELALTQSEPAGQVTSGAGADTEPGSTD